MNLMAVAAAVLVMGLVAGCSSDVPSATLPAVEPSVGVSASPVTTVPEEAKPATGEAASAFARYFIATLDTSFAEADPDVLRTLVAPGCEGCVSLIGLVESLRKEGSRRQGGDYQLIDVVSPAPDANGVVVDISYERTAGVIVGSDGATLRSAPAVPVTMAQMRLIRGGTSWLVQGYRVIS